MNPELLILGLHRVGHPPPDAKIRGLFTSPRLLAFEISLLRAAGYRFATLSEALAAPGGKTAVLTFDDGYRDNLTHALPVLRRFRVPATLFVITGDVGGRAVVWDEAGEKLPSDLLDWDEIAELRAHGWEIGSHAHRHVHLARCTAAEQERTIRESVETIERRLGFTPLSFAYPYGSYNDATRRAVARCGLRWAVTTEPARRGAPAADPLALARCSIGGRRLHHYAKTLARTARAIGAAEPLGAIGANFAHALAARLQPDELTLLSLGTANNNVMTRQ